MSAGSLTSIAPAATSAGLTAKVYGTGFNTTASKNRIRLTPASGAPVDVTPTAITTIDKKKKIHALTFKVPADMPAGPVAIAVTNTGNGTTSEGATLEIVELQMPEVKSAARGAANIVVRITATPNANFVSPSTNVFFGAGITLRSLVVDSATSLRATIDVAGNAALGPRPIGVTTPSMTVVQPELFEIVEAGPVNSAPTAQPGGPYTGAVGKPIAFDGSGSSDPDPGDTLGYSWDFGDNTPPASGALAQHTYETDGTFTVTLTVTDGHGATHSATTTATVSGESTPPADTTPPFVTLNLPTQALAGSQVPVSAIANDDVAVTRVRFFVNDADPSDDTMPPYERVFTIPEDAPAGTVFKVKAVAVDAAGNEGVREGMVTVAAAPDTTPPTVVVKAPPHAARQASINLAANPQDNAGIASVAFFANDVLLATVTQPPYQAEYVIPADAPVGSIIDIKARATDLSGLTGEDVVGVTVVEAPDTTPPTVELSTPPQIGAGRTLLMSALASDNVGVAAVQFFVDDVLVATDTEGPYDASFPVPPTAGEGTSLALRVRAIDYSDLQASDERSVSVLANRAPTANAGGPYTVQAGDLLQLDGTGSSDPDNDALTYTWHFGDDEQGSGPSPSHAYTTPGGFTVTLTVSDGRGGSASATTTVTVTAVADRAPPAVTLSGPSRMLPGTAVEVTAHATDNIAVSSVAFSVDGVEQTVVTQPPFIFSVQAPDVAAPGSTLVVRGTAKDAAGNASADDLAITITASPDTQPPTVSMRLPERTAAGATLIVGADVVDDSGVAAVTFATGATVIATDNEAPFAAAYVVPQDAPAGSNLPFTARATDFSGNVKEASGEVAVAAAGDTTPPTVTLSAPTSVAAGGTLAIAATATDDSGVASVEFFVDGVRVAVDTTAPYGIEHALSAGHLPGALVRLQARAVDFAGHDATAAAESRVTAAGLGVIAGEVFDATTGLPLANASIALIGHDALGRDYSATATSDERGRYLLRAYEGAGRLRITKDQWSTVVRAVTVTTGRAVQPIDARLTPLAPAVAVDPVAGGTLAQDGFEAAILAGALTTPTTLRLTPIGSQGLQALVPGGWSPLAVIDIAPRNIAFGSPVALKATAKRPFTVGTEILFARWDEAANLWRAVSVVPITGDGRQMAAEITATGQYAWLLPDEAPAAPSIPAAGLEVAGVELAPLPDGALSIINPQPKVLFYQPGVRSIVTGAVSASQPLSSGAVLRSRISEAYTFFSGAQAHPEPYTADLVFYQAEAEQGIGASYPVTPSLPFEALSLEQGVIGVELYAPSAEDASLPVIGSEGGAATADGGERLELPPGAVAQPTAFSIAGLAASELGLTLPPGITLAGGIALGFAGELTAPATLSIDRPADLPAGSRVLFASVEEIDGQTRFVLAGVGRIDGSRLVSDIVVPGAAMPLAGARRAGRYVFLRIADPVAFFSGVVSGVTSAPQPDALVTSDRLPLVVSRSASDGRYVAASLTGNSTLTARDPIRNDAGTAQGAVSEPWSVATLALQLVAERPSIVSVSPGPNATGVPLSAPVEVRFSEPIDLASLPAGAGIVLAGPSGAVASTLTWAGNNTIATLRPVSPLAANATYTISVDAGIKDRAGYTLVAGHTSSFASLDTAAPLPPPAGAISARIPVNGQTIVSATQGTAGPHDQVRIVNKTTGAITPATVAPDGSFSVTIAANLTDKLEIRIIDAAGNETVVQVGRFADPDGRVVITAEGGHIDATNGLRLSIAPGTFPDGAIVKFTALTEEEIAPTVPVGEDYPFVAAFEIDASVAPTRYMNVSFPAPAGATETSTGIVAEIVQVYGQRALSIVDTAKIIDGRLATSSPPCEGIVRKFARYAMFMNEHAQMKFGIALLSMTVPKNRPVVLAPFVATNPFLPYPPTILHPGLQFDQLYNPATPFIRYIEATGDTLGGLAAIQSDATPVCFPIPPDTLSKVVVRDAQTGAVIQSVSQTTPPVGEIATITTLHVAPNDTTKPTVLWTSWNPRPPHVLDSGKPIQVQYSEAMAVGGPPGDDPAYLVNQSTGERLPLQVRISPNGRIVTLLPQGALPIGTHYLLRTPGVKDLSGNPPEGTLSFRTYQPTFVLPSVVQGVPSYFTRSHILNHFAVDGIAVGSNLQSVALNDIDFVTLSPEENPTGRWQTTLFGIGNSREFGFQLLTIDASQPRQPRAIGMLPGGQRFYNQMKVLPDIGLTFRELPDGDTREVPLAAWRARELHFLADNPRERACAPAGDPRIAAWRARQAPGASFGMRFGCGTLGLVTSHNTYYSILHLYDLTNPLAPALLGQRLLSDGGGIAGFPRKTEAPAANGAARGVDLIEHVDFTHSLFEKSWTHEDATAAYVAVFGSGVTTVDLGLNVPDLDFRDRPPGGNVIESLQHWTFPYYQDVRTLHGRVVAVARDQWDGTGTAHLEVFAAGLEPIGAPLPLPVEPYMMTVAEGLLTFDEDENGIPEAHDYAFVTGRQGLAMVELRANGGAQLVGFVPMPNVPRNDRGLEVSRITGACPELEFYVDDFKVRTDVVTEFRRGSCEDIVVGARVHVITIGSRIVELTFLEAPTLLLVDSLRHIEIDRDSKLAYIAGTWHKHGATYEGFVIVDVAIPYGGMTDRDEDGWDDRIRGFLPVSGIGAPLASARLNGFRIDQRRKLIYAAVDGEPNDYDEANLVILRTCECAELEAAITLESGGAGTSPDRPSLDGSSTTIFVTPEMLASGQFRAQFDIESFTGGAVHYEVAEFPVTGDEADGLLDLSSGASGTLASGTNTIRLNLRAPGADPRGSVVVVDLTDDEGNFLKRAILHLVPTNVTAHDVKVRTFIDKTNQQIYETPAYLTFVLNHDAKVTIRIDGQIVTPNGDGQTPGTPFVDVPLPAGANQVLITRPMVSIPGEHQYEIRAVYEDGVEMVLTGRAIHEVTIDESLPVGHTFIKGVDLSDGHLALSREDLSLPTVGPALQFARTYSSIGNRSTGVMGAGWSHNYESRLHIDAFGRISIAGGEGSGMRFSQVDGDASSPNTRVFKPQAGYHGQLVYTNGAYDYYTKARTRYHYELSPSHDGDPEYRLTYIEDSNGNRLTLTYAGLLLSKVTDAAGRSLSFTYEELGAPSEPRLTRIDGPMDLVVTYEYDALGNLTTVTRGPRVERYVYSVDQPRDRYNLVRVTDPNGRHTDYTYFAANDTFPGEQPDFQWGRDIVLIPLKHEIVKRVTEGAETPEAATTSFAFDFSQINTRYLTTVTDPRGVQTRYTLNPRGAVVEVRVLDAAGDNVTTMRWAFEDGINDVYMTRKTDPNGRVTRYEYDARGNMTREIIETSLPGFAPVTNAAGDVVTEVVTRWEYEPVFNRLVKKTDPEGNVTEYTIDPENGNVLSITTDPRDGSPPIVTQMTYGDVTLPNGRVLGGLLQTSTDARGHVTRYRKYDDWGNPNEIEDAEGHVTTQVFDERGRQIEVSDTLGHRVTTVYDELDRATSTTRYAVNQPSAPGMASPDRTVTTTYFPGGQKRTETDGLGHLTEYEYDGLNRLRRQLDTIVDADGVETTLEMSFEYDGNGNRRVEVDRRGTRREFTFDALNRQRAVDVVDGGALKRIAEQEFDAAGNLVAEIDLHGHRTAYTLDGLYRRVTVHLPLEPYTIKMSYDLVGNELSVTDANGRTTTREFDGVHRRVRETDPAGNTVRFTYDPAGNLLSETHERTGLVRRHGPYDKVNRPLATEVEFTDPITGEQVVYTTSTQFLDDEHAVLNTNPRGVKVKEVFNGFDQLIERIIDPDGLALTATMRYDENGNEVAVRDAEGSEPDVVRTFDGLNRKIRSQYLLGAEEKTYYDGNDNVVRTIDKRGIDTRYEYDALDRVTTEILIESISNNGQPLVVSSTTYDDANVRTTTLEARQQPMVVEFDALHREVRAIDALNQTTVTTWDGAVKRSVTTPRGLKREFDYDALNRVTAVREFDENGALKTTMTTEYRDAERQQIETDRRGTQRIVQSDAIGRVRRVSRRHADLAARYGAEEFATQEFRYDGNGNVVETVDANGRATRYVYDAADRRTRMIEALGTPVEATTTFTYDRAGNLLTVKDARDHGGAFDVEYTYDERYRRRTRTDGEGNTTTYTYTQNDELASMTEPKGESYVTHYTYDELGTLLSVDETRGGVGGVTRYVYDANRNKIAQQDASGNLTTYVYDAVNRLTDMFEHLAPGAIGAGAPRTAPVGGDTATAQHWHYEYDADGNERLLVDAEGQQVVKTYDHLNRLVRRDYANHRPAAGGAAVYPQLASIVATLDGNGNATRVEETKRIDASTVVTETTLMTFDPLDRLTSRTNPDGKAVAYTYDRQGNRTSVTDADNRRTTYAYDERNQVRSATVEGAGATQYTYWADGLLRSTTSPNGMVSETAYDRADRAITIVAHTGDASAPVSKHEYEYDVNGNRRTQKDTHRLLTAGAAEQTIYEYDALNRLSSVHYPSGAAITYTHALNGNRLTEVGVDPVTEAPVNRTYEYNRLNQLVRIVDHANPEASVVYAYDKNGNTREQRVGALDGEGQGIPAPVSVRQFDFDIRDKLAAVRDGASVTSFDYDFTGRRTKKRGLSEVRFVYDDGSLLQEYDAASGQTLTKYNYGAGLLSLDAVGAGGARQTYYYTFDGLQSASALTDATGAIRASYLYDAFGRLRESADTTPNRRRYTGQYDDTETGLQYFGARYYDPATGRFLSADPYTGTDDNPPSLHRYTYAFGNPLAYTDPTGYMSESVSETASDLAAWGGQVLSGVVKGVTSPLAGLLESGFKGLGDIAMAGIGYLAIEATGHKYIDEIGALLQPMSTIGQAAAEKGTVTAIKESATGFVRDSIKGAVTLPARIVEAAASGDPELLGMTMVEVAQAGTGLKAPLQRATTNGVRTVERVAATAKIMMHERVSKRGTNGKTYVWTGRIAAQDAWALAGLCVQKGATGCGVVGGLQNKSFSNLWKNLRAKQSLARGEMVIAKETGKGYKYQGDVDFMQYRKENGGVMNNADLAREINAQTTVPLLDDFPKHGVLGENMPPAMIPAEVRNAWWKQENLAPGSPIRAFDYQKKGVALSPTVKLPDGSGGHVDVSGRAAYLNKDGKPGVTRRKPETDAFEIRSWVSFLDEMPQFAARPDVLRNLLPTQGLLQNDYEKRRSK